MIKQTRDSPAYEQRVIRVFVSSTFRDMQAERDELVKHTFPQIRKLCDERNVVWSEVDLRWGITEEQSQRGEVLPICLAEIQRCRPYFIGLLGERYGWIPDEIPPELIEQEEWLKEHLHHSVTELEILHGVLNDPQMKTRALFYFREASYIDSLSDKDKSESLEIATAEEIKNTVKMKQNVAPKNEGKNSFHSKNESTSIVRKTKCLRRVNFQAQRNWAR